MARGEIPITLLGSNGIPVAGASIQINLRNADGTTGAAATVYVAATGVTTLTNPLTSGAQGDVDGWLDGPNSYRAVITYGIVSKTVDFEIAPGLDLFSFNITERLGRVIADHYGYRGDNSTDNGAALSAAKTALPAAGGTIVLSTGIGRVVDDPDVAGSGIGLSLKDKAYELEGQGGRSRTIGDGVGTVLRYHGAGGAGTIAFEMGSCVKVKGVDLDGNSLADDVVKVVDQVGITSGLFDYIDSFIHNPRSGGVAWHAVTQYLGYVTDSDIHGGNASGRTAARVESTDIIFRSVILAKGDPCLYLAAGGFRHLGGDISGEGKAITDGGLVTIASTNNALFADIYFGTFTGAGSTPGAMAAMKILGGCSHVTYDHCHYTFNNPSADAVHDYLRIDGSGSAVRKIRVKGGGFRPLLDAPGSRPSAERYRYALNLVGTTQHITFAPDHVVLPGVGVYNTRPDILGDFTVDDDNTLNNTNTKFTKNSGLATFSGDGVTTVFNIPHGLAGTPRHADAKAQTAGARATQFQVTVTSTNVVVTYSTAPVSGASNVGLWWDAEL